MQLYAYEAWIIDDKNRYFLKTGKVIAKNSKKAKDRIIHFYCNEKKVCKLDTKINIREINIGKGVMFEDVM